MRSINGFYQNIILIQTNLFIQLKKIILTNKMFAIADQIYLQNYLNPAIIISVINLVNPYFI